LNRGLGVFYECYGENVQGDSRTIDSAFEDKFLIVKGDLRTYKIHLGSGNILMSPNDQHLCIAPSASAETFGKGKVFLPFEGDRMLSIILSKAFMLAEDK
jgi:hypothetical protein